MNRAQSSTEPIKTEIKGGPWLIRGKETDTIEVYHWPPTRYFIKKAFVAAEEAYAASHNGEEGVDTEAFEEAIVKQCVKSWSLEIPPNAGGWYAIEDYELGEKILQALDMKKVYDSIKRMNKAVTDAKNGTAGGQSPPA